MADNKNEQFSVTTSLISMFDENGYQLRLAGMESGMSIAIWIPQVTPEGKMTFPQQSRFSTILSSDAVGSVDWWIKNRVIPDWQAGKDFKYGVPANRNMTSMIDIIGSGGEIYLRISRDIDEDRKAKNVYQFKFVNTPIIVGYDPQTGAFDVDHVPAQFTMFTEVVSAYTAITALSGHGTRVATKFTISSFYNYLQAISAKLGVVVNTGYKKNPPIDGNKSYGSTPQTGGYNGQMQEVSSISELLG